MTRNVVLYELVSVTASRRTVRRHAAGTRCSSGEPAHQRTPAYGQVARETAPCQMFPAADRNEWNAAFGLSTLRRGVTPASPGLSETMASQYLSRNFAIALGAS